MEKSISILLSILSLSCFGQTDKIADYYSKNAGDEKPSVSIGSVSEGKLTNAKLLPFSGLNFHYFDTLSYLEGRAYVNHKLLKTLLQTYKQFQTLRPNQQFCVMECSNKNGGKISPHRTHQNGLSVDFMVPLLQDNKPYYGLDYLGGEHYLLDFTKDGQYDEDKSITIDFDLIAQHILELDKQARLNGLKISKVIFKIDIKDNLFNTEYGKKLKTSGIYFAQSLTPLINALHDDHYHIDFEILK